MCWDYPCIREFEKFGKGKRKAYQDLSLTAKSKFVMGYIFFHTTDLKVINIGSGCTGILKR